MIQNGRMEVVIKCPHFIDDWLEIQKVIAQNIPSSWQRTRLEPMRKEIKFFTLG